MTCPAKPYDENDGMPCCGSSHDPAEVSRDIRTPPTVERPAGKQRQTVWMGVAAGLGVMGFDVRVINPR